MKIHPVAAFMLSLAVGISATRGQTTVPSSVATNFSGKGVQVGDQVPDAALQTLNGEPERLSNYTRGWTLLVTCSYTCPKSRASYPGLAELAAHYDKKLNVVMVYVIEAHPAGDPSPYRDGKEDITEVNQRDGILRRQPTTLEQRIDLAKTFQKRLDIKPDIAVDSMANDFWKSTGRIPNGAILLNGHDIVLAKQDWLDAAKLRPVIDAEMAAAEKEAADEKSADRKAKELEVKLGGNSAISTWKLYRLTSENDAAALARILDRFPELLNLASPYMARGGYGGETPLQRAAADGRDENVKLLLDRGADPSIETAYRAPALHLASAAGHAKSVQLLLAKIKNANQRSRYGPTALQEALFAGHADIAAMLRKEGARENLYTRAASGDLEGLAADLKKNDGRAAIPDGSYRTALMYAAVAGQIEAAKVLLEAGAPINPLPGKTGDTALLWAARHKQAKMTAFLLEHGASIKQSRDWYDTPLHVAARDNDLDTLKVLLNAKPDLKMTNALAENVLHEAAGVGNIEAIKLLLDAGMDINTVTGTYSMPCGPGPENYSYTPLLLAARGVHEDAVKLLLDRGAKKDLTTTEMKTALHLAVGGGWEDRPRGATIALLLEAGFDVNAEDNEGRTALDYALEGKEAKDFKAVVAQLEKAGAKKGSGERQERQRIPMDGHVEE